MSAAEIAPVGADGQDRAISTLVSAFTHDPVERWLFPELEQYLAHFPGFVEAFGGEGFAEQTAWGFIDLSAVAVWFKPGAEPDGDRIVDALSKTVSPEKLEDAFEMLEQMDAAHPDFDHWYLPWLGVEQPRQGRGLGAQLLVHCLSIVDETGLSAYLETPNPRTIPFYEAHGFEVTARAQAGECPPVTMMLRAARSGR
jgi:ribosomal protein S18 acetylase RimI-like enzyme